MHTIAAQPNAYISLVRKQFGKRSLATAGVYAVLLMFGVALLAPLLADDKPLVMRLDGTWRWPALEALAYPAGGEAGVVDAIFNAALMLSAALLPCLLIVNTAARRSVRKLWHGRLILGALLAALPMANYLYWVNGERNLAVWDYHTMQAEASGDDWFIFPPVPHSPYHHSRADVLAGPSRAHWLGTDQVGRDVLARLIHGSRISLSIGFAAAAVAMSIGVFLGALAGYFGRWVDALILRLVEVMMCLPVLFLILAVMAFVEQRSIFLVMILIGATAWSNVARLVRAEVLRQKQLEYVTAARAVGASPFRVIFREILPNAIQPALVEATFVVAAAILYESTLSFLGLGVPPPVASWGEMINQARQNMMSAPLMAIWPGAAIFVTIVAYNLVGEGLRDALDPRLKQ